MVYFDNQGLRPVDILIQFNRYFSTAYELSDLEELRHGVADGFIQSLLVIAKGHEWCKPPSAPDDSETRDLNTLSWTAEQRAYLIFCDSRGMQKNATLSGYNARFPSHPSTVLVKEINRIKRNPAQLERLLGIMPKYPWWTPELKPGERGYSQGERTKRQNEARERNHLKKTQFRHIMRDIEDDNPFDKEEAMRWVISC